MSEAVIDEVQNSEDTADDEVSATSFKSAEMSTGGNQKVTSKPEEAKTVTKTPLKASDLKVAVEEEKKVET